MKAFFDLCEDFIKQIESFRYLIQSCFAKFVVEYITHVIGG